MQSARFSRVLRSAAAIALVALVLGSAAPAATKAAALPPIPAGMARIWIYRDHDPNLSLARPYVRLNGAVAGISEPGGAFYRDVPPGEYYVTVDSIGQDVDQWARVAVVPGQQVYLKVDNLPYWDCGGGGRNGGGWCRDTFYTRLQLPQVGAAEVARLPFTGGA
ncbi:MAG TPA: hypothetical protein VGR91_01415 [Stellaceae bacterium]|nr:hypothetical protein [Stellaceae bacterium]